MDSLLATVRPWFAALAGAVLLPWFAPASADPFIDGEFVTYDQNIWGADPSDGPPASILRARFFDLFTAGSQFGFPFPGGNVIDFSGPDAMATFLPQSGAPAGLDSSLSDPTSSSAGVFAGQVVALGLNIGFEDLGALAHPAGVSFGDLILTGYTGTVASLNGRTVRQLNQIVNAALGGAFEPFSIVDLSQVLGETNSSFEGGYVSAFAQLHYELPAVTAPVPEPSIWALSLLPMLGLGLFGRRRRPRAG